MRARTLVILFTVMLALFAALLALVARGGTWAVWVLPALLMLVVGAILAVRRAVERAAIDPGIDPESPQPTSARLALMLGLVLVLTVSVAVFALAETGGVESNGSASSALENTAEPQVYREVNPLAGLWMPLSALILGGLGLGAWWIMRRQKRPEADAAPSASETRAEPAASDHLDWQSMLSGEAPDEDGTEDGGDISWWVEKLSDDDEGGGPHA